MKRLPRSRVVELAPPRARFALVLPVWNEGERLARQLVRLAAFRDVCDLVVTDKPSTDGSTELDRLRAAGVRALISLEDAGGYSTSLRAAIHYALGQGYEALIFMDGNDKDDASAIPAFARELDAGYEYVQGSRYIRGGRAVDHPLGRTVMIRLLHAPLLSLALRRRFTDTTNGFRAFSRRVLMDPRVDPVGSGLDHYELPVYLATRAVRLGYRSREIPVTRTYPREGPVPTRITGLLQHWRMLRPVLMALLGRW